MRVMTASLGKKHLLRSCVRINPRARPDGSKIAVIRDPKVGYDDAVHFTPGATYDDPRNAAHRLGPVKKPDADHGLTGLVTSPVADPVRYGRSCQSSRPGFQSWAAIALQLMSRDIPT